MDRDYEDEFYLITDNGEIYLKLLEVFDFPTKTSFLGGYDARAVIDIKCDNYSAKGNVNISTGQLYRFLQELKVCYQTLKGTACLKDYEGSLEMILNFDGIGHVKISGHFRDSLSSLTELKFEMDTDRTRIPQMIYGLEDLDSVYGDEKGLSAQ